MSNVAFAISFDRCRRQVDVTIIVMVCVAVGRCRRQVDFTILAKVAVAVLTVVALAASYGRCRRHAAVAIRHGPYRHQVDVILALVAVKANESLAEAVAKAITDATRKADKDAVPKSVTGADRKATVKKSAVLFPTLPPFQNPERL